jgi:hypothetical protein
MTIQSIDQLITALASGASARTDFNKITGAAAYASGRWYDMMSLAGYPVATAYPGTALTYVPCDDATGDGTNRFGIPHGGNVSPSVKNLLSMLAMTTAATGVPSVLKLIDLVGYWPGINMNVATLQTLSGTPSLTRYPSGAGLRFALAARATTGATAHNLSYSYTNQAGTTGRVNPVTVACTVSAIVPHLVHSGIAANNFGPELPLASGDTGVQNIASVQLSAGSGSGTAVLLLYKVLATITLSIQSLAAEKDLLNQIPSLPRIPDGACLGLLLGTGAAVAANTSFYGAIETAWG